ncbi:hypothetical protein ABPG75_007515 [Micractinium tetrahymenae]
MAPATVGDYASKVAPFLPTGTFLVFQTVLQLILPGDGMACTGGQQAGTAAWLGIMCVGCALLSWTDSSHSPDGTTVYALVLPGGLRLAR